MSCWHAYFGKTLCYTCLFITLFNLIITPSSFAKLLPITNAMEKFPSSSLTRSSKSLSDTAQDVSSQWQKRAIPTEEEMDENTESSSDTHQRIDHHYPEGRYSPTPLAQGKQNRDKWMNKRIVLFNKDRQGALEWAKYYQWKEAHSEHPDLRIDAMENQLFWYQKAIEWTDGDLYDKHRQELVNHLQNKVEKYSELNMPRREQKWQRLLNILNGRNINKIKHVESDYHTKALKAMQNREEWLEEHLPRQDPHPSKPFLASFSNPDKNSLLLPLDTPTGSPQHESSSSSIPDYQQPLGADPDDLHYLKNNPDLRAYREQKHHQKLMLQDPTHVIMHATNTERIERKMSENSTSREKFTKWRNRIIAKHQDLDEDHTKHQLKHYRNKEVKKRWQQLRWASAAHQMERGSSNLDADLLASSLSSLDMGENSGSSTIARRRRGYSLPLHE